MRWTRRGFLGLSLGSFVGLGLGIFGGLSLRRVRATLEFDSWRSVPGELQRLRVSSSDDLSGYHLELRRKGSGTLLALENLGAARVGDLEFVVPYCKVESESFILVAVLVDRFGRSRVESGELEVLSRPFCFGM